MKKAGETAKSYAIHGMFVVVILLGLYFIVTTSPTLTGHAVLDASTAKAKLESALSSSSMFSQVTQASFCVVINDPEQPLSLQAMKTSSGWTVSEMVGFCAGMSSEDVIVQFPDYDSYSKMVDNPSPRNLASGAINRDYEILESKYVDLGGNVVCDATFKVKYCSALTNMATPEQLIDGDMACCLDKMTRAQKKLLEQHMQEGNFKDELGIVEEPSSGIAGMNMTTSIIALVVVVLLVIGIAVGVMMKGKPKPKTAKVGIGGPGAAPAQAGQAMPGVPQMAAPSTMQAQPAPVAQPVPVAQPAENPAITELRSYVVDVLGHGYDPGDVRTHLLEIGWDTGTADQIIQEAYQIASQAQQNN